MNDRFKRALTVSTAVHAGVILLVVVTPFVSQFVRRHRPKPSVTFIDMVASLPALPAVPADTPAPTPVPAEPDKPQPAAPVVKSTAGVKSGIKVSTNKIVRQSGPKPSAASPIKSNLTPEQIKKMLDSGVKFTGVAGGSGGQFSDLGLYYAIVQQAMYSAWQQPSSVAKGLTAEVALQVARNGAVVQHRLSRSSGNSMMDASVMRAVESVPRLKPLPPEIGGPQLDVTVEFVVGDGF